MKKVLLVLFIIALLSGISTSLILTPKLFTQSSQQKTELPDIELKTAADKSIKLKKAIDRKTILLFWLPKSSICQQQLKILQQLKTEYQTNLQIYGITIGNIQPTKLKRIKKENSLEFPLVIDRRTELTEELMINSIPTLIFINNQGVITERHTGLLTLPDLKKNLDNITTKSN